MYSIFNLVYFKWYRFRHAPRPQKFQQKWVQSERSGARLALQATGSKLGTISGKFGRKKF